MSNRHLLKLFICACLLLPATAHAVPPPCLDGDCTPADLTMANLQSVTDSIIKGEIAEEFSKQRKWETTNFFKNKFLPAIKRLTAQNVTVGKQQMQITGSLMDADEQLDRQQAIASGQIDAQKQYQPDEKLLCSVGTNVRSMASSEERSRQNAAALSGQSLSRQMGNAESSGASSPDADKEARWKQYASTYCGKEDNNSDPNNPQSGMGLACGSGAADKTRINKDIDYTRLIDTPRTLDVNFQDTSVPADEADVQAFLANIFPPLSRGLNGSMQGGDTTQGLNMGLRSIASRRGVAQNSFNAIIGMKSAGTSDDGSTREYLASIMKELGVPENEVYAMIGDKPSYFTQLEILAKSIYQTPGFYTQLYDKPANIERKAVALKAINLMLDRALYESEQRQEMMMSVLLATKTDEQFQSLSRPQ